MTSVKKSIKDRIPILDLKKQYGILEDDDTNDSIRYLVGFTLVFSLMYFIAPIDIVPDILFGLGYLDDLTIYAFLREVGYRGADMETGVKEAMFEVLESKTTAVIVALLFVLVAMVSTVSYFLIL